MSKSIDHPEDLSPSVTAVTSGQSHTPGPWVTTIDGCVRRTSGEWHLIKIISPWIEGAWKDDEEALANMRLISAAPDMLEALLAQEDLQQRGILNMTDAEVADVRAKRRAAIAKATPNSDSGG